MRKLLLALVLLLTVSGCQTVKMNEGVTYFGDWKIPEHPRSNPNKLTLDFHLMEYLRKHNTKRRYAIRTADHPYQFEFNITSNQYVRDQLQKTGLLSYLVYENGQIVTDELTPEDRFGDQVQNDTNLYGMSLAKSMTSYILGHAICDGYISSVDQTLADWPLLKDTLYADKSLRQMMKMAAGDADYAVKDGYGWKVDKYLQNRSYYSDDIAWIAKVPLSGSKVKKGGWNYNGLNPRVVLNYIIFKLDDNFEPFLNSIFVDKIGVENEVWLTKIRGSKDESLGIAEGVFRATRYDFLRIGRAILNDWDNDTCVGKYLKDIYQDRIRKTGSARYFSRFFSFAGYAGYFHTDLFGSDQNIMGMDGYGGQSLVINFDTKRIIYAHAIFDDYDWRNIVASEILKK